MTATVDVPSTQTIRSDLLSVAVRMVTPAASGSHLARTLASVHARYRVAIGAATVFDAPAVNPSAVWCLTRSPRACSYPTATVWLHQSPHSWSCRKLAISLCGHFAAPALSRSANQSAQPLPVLARTASDLIPAYVSFPSVGTRVSKR